MRAVLVILCLAITVGQARAAERCTIDRKRYDSMTPEGWGEALLCGGEKVWGVTIRYSGNRITGLGWVEHQGKRQTGRQEEIGEEEEEPEAPGIAEIGPCAALDDNIPAGSETSPDLGPEGLGPHRRDQRVMVEDVDLGSGLPAGNIGINREMSAPPVASKFTDFETCIPDH